MRKEYAAFVELQFKKLFLWFPNARTQLHNSTDSTVVLENVNLSTSGRFRCEVSGEAPSFQTVSDHGDMIVVGKYTFTFPHKYLS